MIACPSFPRLTRHSLSVVLPHLGFWLVLMMVSHLHAAGVSLTWNANGEADLAGYNVYQRILPSIDYGSPIYSGLPTNPASPQTTITNLPDNTSYGFIATAFDSAGNESSPSIEALVTITVQEPPATGLTLSPPTATVPAGGQQTFTGGGGVAPYSYAVAADTTGAASVNATTGLYTAGPNGGTSTVRVTDANLDTVDAAVTVTSASVNIPQGQMTVVSASSDGANKARVLDGASPTMWQAYDTSGAAPPHEMILALGGNYLVSEFRYLPFSWTKCTQYEVYVSATNGSWGSAVAAGTWAKDPTEKTASFLPTPGAFLRIRYLNSYCYAAEHNVFGAVTSGGS
jgi:hypothetical protein